MLEGSGKSRILLLLLVLLLTVAVALFVFEEEAVALLKKCLKENLAERRYKINEIIKFSRLSQIFKSHIFKTLMNIERI